MMLGLGQSLVNQSVAATGGIPWILATGFWNDSGIWKDDALWID